ncbi:YqaA family protein [Thalassotalea ponticola]|uniref:YqaA family protein n=1 Tax=Thalassotalea ponticola TaxID=1523392 RepID=UPI0025B597C2|nr:YqaA family protein [Thalassotalea ponticola]MDN3652137.1 YqaA family protein [Thalassotalea ponticola]
MKIFSALYQWTMRWATHTAAPKVLAVLSFAESVFFPIPPDVLLAPMVLSKPEHAWRLAGITTLGSVLGGVVGYFLGYWLFEPVIKPLLIDFNYMGKFEHAMQWFQQYGVWVVFIAGFSPIPYKVFTLSAGFLQMLFLPFLLASAVGRGMRFYLVAALIKAGGAKMEHKLRNSVDAIGWGVVILAAILYVVFG